jgi:hypothetical protein
MVRLLTLVGLLLTCLPSRAAEPDVPGADELARRLAETTWGMEEMLAGKVEALTVTLRIEELDAEGRVKHLQERVDRIRVKEGQQSREILQASKDGEDATRALREELRERQARGEGRAEFNSVNLPFAAASLAQHRFFLAEPDPKEPRRLRLRFEPREGKAPWLHTGEALVDGAGQLLRLSYSPSVLPDHAHRVEVRMDFRPLPGLGQVLDTLRVEAEGGFLFYKKRLRITARYSHLVLPTSAPSASAFLPSTP